MRCKNTHSSPVAKPQASAGPRQRARAVRAAMSLALGPVALTLSPFGTTAMAQTVTPVSAEVRTAVGEPVFHQIWTSDADSFAAAWQGDAAALGAYGPAGSGLATSARRGELLQMFIAIERCRADRRGRCQLHGTFELIRPDGLPDGERIEFAAWNGAAPGAKGAVLSLASIGAAIDGADPTGSYTARLTLLDAVARRSSTSTVTLTFTD